VALVVVAVAGKGYRTPAPQTVEGRAG
jgi:hypothetical protein